MPRSAHLTTTKVNEPWVELFLSGVDTMPFEFVINGRPTRVDVSANTPLLWVVRDVLNLRGTKYGCGVGRAVPVLCTLTAKPRGLA